LKGHANICIDNEPTLLEQKSLSVHALPVSTLLQQNALLSFEKSLQTLVPAYTQSKQSLTVATSV